MALCKRCRCETGSNSRRHNYESDCIAELLTQVEREAAEKRKAIEDVLIAAIEVARVRKALAVYADWNNWTPMHDERGNPLCIWDGDGFGDEIAKRALKEG